MLIFLQVSSSIAFKSSKGIKDVCFAMPGRLLIHFVSCSTQDRFLHF